MGMLFCLIVGIACNWCFILLFLDMVITLIISWVLIWLVVCCLLLCLGGGFCLLGFVGLCLDYVRVV